MPEAPPTARGRRGRPGRRSTRPMTRTLDQRMGALAQVVEERMAALERTMSEQVLALSTATTAAIERNLDRMSAAAGPGRRARRDGRRGRSRRSRSGCSATSTSGWRRSPGSSGPTARRSPARSSALSESAARPRPSRSTRELLRSVLRSIKELQAGMASDMLGTIDVRFQQVADQLHREGQEQAEAMLKVAEVLGAEDRPAVGPRRRGRRQRPADRRRPDVRRDPRDVGRAPRHRIATGCNPAETKAASGPPSSFRLRRAR